MNTTDTRTGRRQTLRSLFYAGWFLLAALGCDNATTFPNRPITLVCPWAAGGGTDRVSRQMAVHLQQELGVPVNVINATGGKGVTGHSRGLYARPDGHTLAMITLELNMMHWSGLTGLTYADCVPLTSINEDYAALFVRGDATWQSLTELEAAIRAQPGDLKASGTASGGAWHLALAGWLLAIEVKADDVIWVSSTGAGPSLQELLSGGLDMVCCSVPEARALLEAGEVRALGVMAPARAASFPQVPTFAEQGTDWQLGGWRGLAVPRGTPPDRVAALTRAIQRVVTGQTRIQGQTFPDFMEAQGFDHTWRGPDEFRQFLAETDDKFGRLLSSQAMRSVRVDPFPPLFFPGVLLAWIGTTLTCLVVVHFGKRGGASRNPLAERPSPHAMSRFAAVVVAILAYVWLAESAGFLLTVAGALFCLLWLFGTRPAVSGMIAVVLTPAVYQLFANVLRVPLPRGWLG